MVALSHAGGTPSIQECLVGIAFPVSKDEPLEKLRMNGATELLLEPIRRATQTRFASPQEVIDTIRGG
jgi:hypothetical protein